ncbi:MAG: outer membrane beta-barrel family protein, partial [Bacteroidota bacterium]
GAKYEAEGNAGIIDIRLKRNENEGGNGSVSTTVSQGEYLRYNLNANGNFRNSNLNIFGNVGYADNESYNYMEFRNFQNGFVQDDINRSVNRSRTPSYRLGTDFFLGKKHTIGFLVGGIYTDNDSRSFNNVDLFTVANASETPDSLLRARTIGRADRGQNTFNLNYRYDAGKGKSLNIDLDYGRFRNDNLRDQPNTYLSPDGGEVLSNFDNYFDTPIDIDIATAQVDFEQPLAGGQFGAGIRLSQVGTDNTFLFYDVPVGGDRILNSERSNQFDYDENVYAAYLSFAGKLNEKMNFSAGLRSEVTDATGDLTAFNGQSEPPVDLDYVSFFPSVGLTYALNQRKGNTLSLNYGRRINRPDYNVLNPFRNQLSQLSYERGNPRLSPEIV